MSLGIIIHTCDNYSFIWDKFIQHFNNHQFTNHYPVYFCNEVQSVSFTGIQQIKTEIGSWSDRLKIALNVIKEENILYLQEDFIIDLVNHIILKKCINFHTLLDNDITKLGSFVEFTLKEKPLDIDGLPIYYQKPSSKYIMSHQPPAIFKKSFLLSTLNESMSPWEHECGISDKINRGEINCKSFCVGHIQNNCGEIIQYRHALRGGKYIINV